MAIKQVEWRQELNKESGKWWLSALILGVLQGLLAWGSLPLAGRVWGISEMTGSVKFYLLALLLGVGLCFSNGWLEQHQKQGKIKSGKRRRLLKVLGIAALVAGLGVALWLLYGGRSEDWSQGFQLFRDTYLARVDLQKREYELRYRDATRLQPVIELLLLELLMLAEVIGGRLGKRKLVLLIPVSVVCAGLLVLAVPSWKALALVFVCGVLIIRLENSARILWKQLVVLGAVLVLFIAVAGRYEEDAEEQMLAMNEDWFEHWGQLGESLSEKLVNFEFFQGDSDTEVIDNEAPKYDDEPVLKLEMDKKAGGTIYLRGNYCTDYEDSTWETDEGPFAEACEEYGIEEDRAAERLLETQYKQEKKLYNSPVSYKIRYTENCDSYAYLPYAAGWEESPEECEFSRDSVIKRKKTENKIIVTGWTKLSFIGGNESVVNEYSYFQEWYNNFVYENYLTVAPELEEVQALAKKLKKEELPGNYGQFLTPGNHTADVVNYYRVQTAYAVADYLKEHGTYSLELDELPKGEDVVEYFLENHMEGFCEHFASAGTLILRELGVPARYATGYVVWQSDFAGEGGEYEATVLDSAAHAWTEIYLENYGWVPIEMTPGYDNANRAPQATEPPEEEPTPEPTSSPEEEPTPIPEDPEPTEEPEATEAPGEEDESSGEDEDSLDEEDEDDEDARENDRKTGALGKVLVVALVLVLVAGFGIVTYGYLSKRKGHGMKRLAGYMRQGENRNAIRWINKLMYERTVEKGKRKLKYSDAEYLAVLKETYPQIDETHWDAYFTLVRKAVYSKEQLTIEETKLCYEVYKTVLADESK